MKRVRWMILAGVASLVIGLAGVFCGCEDTPALADLDGFFAAHPTFPDPRTPGNKPLDVVTDPPDAKVDFPGDTVSLLVLGGPSEYEWWIVDQSVGRFIQNDEHTDTVIYEALQVADNTVYVMDSRGRAAVVAIQANIGELSILPSSVTVPTNAVTQVNFQALNGVAPFTWNVSRPGFGGIVSAGNGASAVYTSVANVAGDNIVTVRDGRGFTAQASVKHSGE